MQSNERYLTDILSYDPFNDLDNEVEWSLITESGGTLPRLINVQGDINGPITPIYRHPINDNLDMIPWTPTVYKIKQEIEKVLNCSFNHALIQKYRNGNDFIGLHSDKTLDIAKNSLIVNYSCGATRIFELKSKLNDHYTKRIPLASNSILVLDLVTNKLFKHAIRKDHKVNAPRISITFRTIATFYNSHSQSFSGQGSHLVNQDLIKAAFKQENKSAEFEWDKWYSN